MMGFTEAVMGVVPLLEPPGDVLAVVFVTATINDAVPRLPAASIALHSTV